MCSEIFLDMLFFVWKVNLSLQIRSKVCNQNRFRGHSNNTRIFFLKLLLLRFLILKAKVDYNGRCETPMGIAGKLRPRRSVCDEEAQLTPHGKRASCSCNQLSHSKIATLYTKTALIFNDLVYSNK